MVPRRMQTGAHLPLSPAAHRRAHARRDPGPRSAARTLADSDAPPISHYSSSRGARCLRFRVLRVPRARASNRAPTTARQGRAEHERVRAVEGSEFPPDPLLFSRIPPRTPPGRAFVGGASCMEYDVLTWRGLLPPRSDRVTCCSTRILPGTRWTRTRANSISSHSRRRSSSRGPLAVDHRPPPQRNPSISSTGGDAVPAARVRTDRRHTPARIRAHRSGYQADAQARTVQSHRLRQGADGPPDGPRAELGGAPAAAPSSNRPPATPAGLALVALERGYPFTAVVDDHAAKDKLRTGGHGCPTGHRGNTGGERPPAASGAGGSPEIAGDPAPIAPISTTTGNKNGYDGVAEELRHHLRTSTTSSARRHRRLAVRHGRGAAAARLPGPAIGGGAPGSIIFGAIPGPYWQTGAGSPAGFPVGRNVQSRSPTTIFGGRHRSVRRGARDRAPHRHPRRRYRGRAFTWRSSGSRPPAGSTVVVLCCDAGEKYLDTIYDDDWLRARDLLEPRGRTNVLHRLLGNALRVDPRAHRRTASDAPGRRVS